MSLHCNICRLCLPRNKVENFLTSSVYMKLKMHPTSISKQSPLLLSFSFHKSFCLSSEAIEVFPNLGKTLNIYFLQSKSLSMLAKNIGIWLGCLHIKLFFSGYFQVNDVNIRVLRQKDITVTFYWLVLSSVISSYFRLTTVISIKCTTEQKFRPKNFLLALPQKSPRGNCLNEKEEEKINSVRKNLCKAKVFLPNFPLMTLQIYLFLALSPEY